MAGVKTESDGLAVVGANTSVRAEQQNLWPEQGIGLPPHAYVLAQTKEVSGRPLHQHLRSRGEAAGGTACVRGYGLQQRSVLRFKHGSERRLCQLSTCEMRSRSDVTRINPRSYYVANGAG